MALLWDPLALDTTNEEPPATNWRFLYNLEVYHQRMLSLLSSHPAHAEPSMSAQASHGDGQNKEQRVESFSSAIVSSMEIKAVMSKDHEEGRKVHATGGSSIKSAEEFSTSSSGHSTA
jgi:hypothetical protein